MNTLSGGGEVAWLFTKVVIALLIVIGLALVFIRYGMPRGRFFSNKKRLQWMTVLDRVPLDHRHSLMIVKILNRFFVLSLSDQGSHLVTELSQAEGEKIEAS